MVVYDSRSKTPVRFCAEFLRGKKEKEKKKVNKSWVRNFLSDKINIFSIQRTLPKPQAVAEGARGKWQRLRKLARAESKRILWPQSTLYYLLFDCTGNVLNWHDPLYISNTLLWWLHVGWILSGSRKLSLYSTKSKEIM